MKRCCAALVCSVLWFASASAEVLAAQEDSGEVHVAAARAATYRSGDDFSWVFDGLCFEPTPTPPSQAGGAAAPGERRPLERSDWFQPPAQVFDNLYFLATLQPGVTAEGVAAWAITTSEGIILIDAVYDYSVEVTVDEGLRTLGLDPADIKYVILTHGHPDHSGGARHLQDTYGARILVSELDWDLLASSNGLEEEKPRRDMVITDGMELTLGDTTVTLYLTPGHTLGTVSALVPLKDGERSHMGSIWGGNRVGTRYYSSPAEGFRAYYEAARRYREIVMQARADVYIASHIAQDKTLNKINALRFRGPADPHPFVGGDAPERHLTVVGECAGARWARHR